MTHVASTAMAQSLSLQPTPNIDDERSPLVIERRMHILNAVNNQGSISVAELINLLGSSPATVRRDLAWLHNHGMIARTRGGAVAIERISQLTRHYDPAYERRLNEYIEEKKRLAD